MSGLSLHSCASIIVMMSLFDTHCHLDFDSLEPLRDAVMQGCKRVGVRRIVVPGITVKSWPRLLAMCAAASDDAAVQLYPALGLHPCFMPEHDANAMQQLERYVLAAGDRLVAIGEIGLDFWPGHLEPERQLLLFDAQLQLAVHTQLPVIIHSRKAHDQVWQRLRSLPQLKGGVIHAFSGSRQQADRFLALGFKLGIGGAITYERANKLRQIVADIPLDAIVLETDAPDMPLFGRQGEPNRPDYLPAVLQCLAELRSESIDTIAQQVWQNSLSLFGQETE